MCDWNSGASPARDPLGGDVEQRPDEAVELVLGAVVGVQRDVDRVGLGDLGGVRREGDRAGDHVLDVGPERYSAPPVETWTMPSRAGLGEALERRVQGLRGRHVDGREGEALRLRGVQHLGVLLGGGDGHGGTPRQDWVSRDFTLVAAAGSIEGRPHAGTNARSGAGRLTSPRERVPGDLLARPAFAGRRARGRRRDQEPAGAPVPGGDRRGGDAARGHRQRRVPRRAGPAATGRRPRATDPTSATASSPSWSSSGRPRR